MTETSKPSQSYAPSLTRTQTEEIWRLLHQQPQKTWAPHKKAFPKALRENPNGKIYLETP